MKIAPYSCENNGIDIYSAMKPSKMKYENGIVYLQLKVPVCCLNDSPTIPRMSFTPSHFKM